MKSTNNEQINTKVYWDYIYNTPAKKKEYWQRTSRFFTLVDLIKDGDKFLDIGCGVGVPASIINEKKKDVETWGVDISGDVIEANKKEMPYAKWFQGYAESLKFLPNNYFDVIFSGEVIEHMTDPSHLFEESYRLLKSGGKLVISTPHEDKIRSSEHVWYFDEDDICSFFENAGFNKIDFVKLPDTEHILVIFAVGTK
jgi:ubiquinone/menaquinone biosynthesis C-methylase UbiE